MNKKILYWILSVGLITGLSSCEKHEVIFDHPFVYITDNNTNASANAQVDCLGNYESSYALILSSKTLDKDLIVTYDIEVGNGLKEGVDFQLISSKSVAFPVGLYKNVIHIKWLPNNIDDSKNPDGSYVKNNTLKIVLKSNSMNFTIGYPGPNKNNSVYTITKIKTI